MEDEIKGGVVGKEAGALGRRSRTPVTVPVNTID
jgi:hypothetical protein